MFRSLPRTVVLLGFVSLLNDAASDMVIPLLPVYLTVTLGAGAAALGLIEGTAEATASLLKLYAGRLADRGWAKKPLTVAGYAVSCTARPLIGAAAAWPIVLGLRFFDRVGKGLRTSPRDALIAEAAAEGRRGRSFGFHRAMDNAGAVLGPLLAFGALAAGVALHQVFYLAAVPGILVILLLVFGVTEPRRPVTGTPAAPLRWGALPGRLRALVIAAGGLSFAAVPEAFLMLWATDRGVAVYWLPLLWALMSGVRTVVAAPAGHFSDRVGTRSVLAIGWALRALMLVVLAATDTTSAYVIAPALMGYAATLAFTEGAERALVADVAPSPLRASAFGLYHMVVGLLALPGAALFGYLWERFGDPAALSAAATAAIATLAVFLYLSRAERGLA